MHPFLPFSILHEDDQVVAINKPPGILVHRTKISEDQVFVLQLLRTQIQQKVFPIHRLDRGTSGVLVFGKNKAAAAYLGEQMRSKKVEKKYLAIIRGYVDEKGTIDYPLASEPHKEKKEALSHYKRLKQIEFAAQIGRYPSARYSLVEIETETGRRHQIRRHFSHLRHPIIGDKKHGDVKHNTYFRDSLEIPRMLLHASDLSYVDERSQKKISMKAPLEEGFIKALDLLGFSFLQ